MKIYDILAKWEKENRSFVTATVVKAGGSVPGKVGFKLAVNGNDEIVGTVGGGAIEARAIEECRQRLLSGESGLAEYSLTPEPPANQSSETEHVSMMCTGKVTIYYEAVIARPTVYIFGGGHLGKALSALLKPLHYFCVLVDNRPEFANPTANPNFHQHFAEDYQQFSSQFQPPAGSFAVIMTHGHGYDYDVAYQLLKRKLPFKYIGIISSRTKAAKLLKQLKEALGNQADLSHVYAPVGLEIGGSTESEIALSIASEIQAIHYGKKQNHLRLEPSKQN